MVEIKAKQNGKKVEVEARGEVKGYDNAVSQFVAVIMALDKMSGEVLIDALEEFMKTKMEGDDDDESEG